MTDGDVKLPTLLQSKLLTLPLKKPAVDAADDDGDNSTNASPNGDSPDFNQAPSVRSQASSSVYYTPKEAVIGEADGQIPSFEDHYQLKDRVLGSGAAGDVREAICRRTGRKVAVKTYAKDNMSEKALANMKCELDVHLSLSHPAIVKLEGVYETDTTVRVVMEQLQGGELFDRILELGRFSELQAAKTCLQILRVLAYLHGNRIVHRDIKPENIMYWDDKGDTVKLIDFGFACKRARDVPLTQKCGTMQYVAPEVLKGEPYDSKVDLWSLGNVTYIMLTGRPLYCGDERQILRNKKADKLHMSKQFRWCISDPAQDLVSKMLDMVPGDRITAYEAMSHAWFRRTIPNEQAAALAEARELCQVDELSDEEVKPATRVFKLSSQSHREFESEDPPPNPLTSWVYSILRDIGVNNE